jgi:diguanylate cyclase (GGDEF)-like protein
MNDDKNDDEDVDSTSVASRAEMAEALARQAEAQGQRPYVVVVNGKTSIGKMFRIDGTMVVGRAPASEVCLDEEGVSRSHAKLTHRADGIVELEDLGSTNGTFVNAKRIEKKHMLRDGDKVQIGSISILKFSYQDALDEELQKNLYESATRDALTRVSNKKTFLDALAKEFAFAARHKRPLSVAIFDIDHFKRINDTRGHVAGDHVLVSLAQRVEASVRTEDMFARYGGEEFVLLLRDTSEAEAILCAERVRLMVEGADIVYEKVRIPVTISVGVATLTPSAPDSYADAEALLKSADKYLYRAKQGGRNRVSAKGLELAPP